MCWLEQATKLSNILCRCSCVVYILHIIRGRPQWRTDVHMTVELEQKYLLCTVLTRLYCYSEYVVLRLLKHETGWNNYGRTLGIFRHGNETATPIMKLLILVTR